MRRESGSVPKLTNRISTQGYYGNNPDGKSKGTAILVHKSIPFLQTETETDSNGRYVFVKGSLLGQNITLANIYASNSKHGKFLKSTLKTLMSFTEEFLILGGDFNIALKPGVATSTGTSAILEQILLTIRHTLHIHRLRLHTLLHTPL
ncbi:Hypothetical predicted protein [Pelobates cultripes]|uniref:Endonuclease/exonuclease/phosphatase domain-containing protein n=1 Tax=Pelobates cultripes TaxID=61616 RepID=A0AAD1SYK8_PELCU|nr:Hypothetical predicted protein [Pelobates cultripes]